MKSEPQQVIEQNKEEFSGFYTSLRFVTPDAAYKASLKREELLNYLQSNAEWGFNRTKVDCSVLSPGCKACGEGTWSCLFINNICNANCFYCPTSQDEYSEPTTQTVQFPDVENYIAYIKKFGFKGISISGGEPFLTFDKTLRFVKKIKEEFKEDIYLWLYTNGILADKEKLLTLKEIGLNEIRFDIGAVGYKTDKVELACQIFDNVTVEIPAVPERKESLKELISHLKSIGVSYLNLHQIRCTPHNYKSLVKKGYTFLHGPKITVLESELTALELIRYAKENNIDLPINYCSFIYKYRYQRLAARRLFAPYVAKSYEDLTEAGLIRTLALIADADKIKKQTEKFELKGIPTEHYFLSGNNDKLFIKKYLWELIKPEDFTISLMYSKAFLLPHVSYRNIFKEISLNYGKKIAIERTSILNNEALSNNQVSLFDQFICNDPESLNDYRHIDTIFGEWREKCSVGEEIDFMIDVYDCEKLRWGLLDYY